jgi:hypothetical protein
MLKVDRAVINIKVRQRDVDDCLPLNANDAPAGFGQRPAFVGLPLLMDPRSLKDLLRG